MRPWPANGRLCGWRSPLAGSASLCTCGPWWLRWSSPTVTSTERMEIKACDYIPPLLLWISTCIGIGGSKCKYCVLFIQLTLHVCFFFFKSCMLLCRCLLVSCKRQKKKKKEEEHGLGCLWCDVNISFKKVFFNTKDNVTLINNLCMV